MDVQPVRDLSRDVSKDRAAMLTISNPLNFNFTTPAPQIDDLNSIQNALLTSRRVFPIDVPTQGTESNRKIIKKRMPLSKITVMEDSTVSIRQPKLNASNWRR